MVSTRSSTVPSVAITVTVNVDVPALVGVPVMAPVCGFKVTPCGSEPLVTENDCTVLPAMPGTVVDTDWPIVPVTVGTVTVFDALALVEPVTVPGVPADEVVADALVLDERLTVPVEPELPELTTGTVTGIDTTEPTW